MSNIMEFPSMNIQKNDSLLKDTKNETKSRKTFLTEHLCGEQQKALRNKARQKTYLKLVYFDAVKDDI